MKLRSLLINDGFDVIAVATTAQDGGRSIS